jgi:hypothetical protein
MQCPCVIFERNVAEVIQQLPTSTEGRRECYFNTIPSK